MSNNNSQNDLDKWISRGGQLIGLLTLFGFLLYFVGRRYAEQYFGIIGIPYEGLSLDFYDYLYFGSQPIQLLIVFVFTFFGIGIFRLLTFPTLTPSYISRKPRTNIFISIRNKIRHISIVIPETMRGYNERTLDRWMENGFYTYLIFVLSFSSFALPIVALVQIFGNWSTSIAFLSWTVVVISLLMFIYGFAIMAFFDNGVLQKISEHRFVKNWILFGSILSLILLPYLGAGAYASFKGYLDITSSNPSSKFNTVTLIANSPTSNLLGWEKTEDNIYQTKETLYLIYASDDNLYLESKDDMNEIVVVPKTDFSTYVINNRYNLVSSSTTIVTTPFTTP
jgi:hypothetical protein